MIKSIIDKIYDTSLSMGKWRMLMGVYGELHELLNYLCDKDYVSSRVAISRICHWLYLLDKCLERLDKQGKV